MEYFQRYFDYIGTTEAPDVYHRWVATSIIGAILGREYWYTRGPITYYPNFYIKLMGPAGGGKGTAIGIGRDLLRKIQYNKFAPTKMSKESFILSMHKIYNQSIEDEMERCTKENLSILDLNPPDYSDMYVMASEFNSVVPPGDVDYLMMLTDLWDNLPVWDNPKITSKSVKVDKPTINLLAANTPQMFNSAFPAESVGNGTLSRFILITSPATGKKIFDIPALCDDKKAELCEILDGIRKHVKGHARLTPHAKLLLQNIYEDFPGLQDTRFDAYNSRRISHLIKLCLIFSAADLSTEINEQHVLYANTQLCAAECSMPSALGHFGRSKSSALMHRILEYINSQPFGATAQDITTALIREIHSNSELAQLMDLLAKSDQIQAKNDPRHGYVWFTKPQTFPQWAKPYIDTSFLTDQEKELCNLPPELKKSDSYSSVDQKHLGRNIVN